MGESDSYAHRARVTSLGQWTLGSLSVLAIIVGCIGFIADSLAFAIVATASGTFFAYRIGWCWADAIEIRDNELQWHAPFRNGTVPTSAVTRASWRVVRSLVYPPIVVVKVQNARNVSVWFDRTLPSFLAEHGMPMTRTLRSW